MIESDRATVLLVGQNLFFLGKVEAVAEPLGYEVQRAATDSTLPSRPPDAELARGLEPLTFGLQIRRSTS